MCYNLCGLEPRAVCGCSKQASLQSHISKLEETLDRVGSTADKMRELLAQLEGWREWIEKHEPPRVLPDDMEKQIAEFSVSSYVHVLVHVLWDRLLSYVYTCLSILLLCTVMYM